MPAISAIYDFAIPLVNTHLESRKEHPYRQDKKTISPVAIGFLVPLFICIILGPILCIACTRKRRDGQSQPRTSVSTSRHNSAPIPKMSREDARRALSDVTQVVPLERREGEKFACMATMNEKVSTESTSIFEKECAICLSTLHAPSPPEPVKLSAVDTERVAPPTLSSISTLSLSGDEAILRLHKCGHEFHAECLISWFVLAKWSCPICRALYYTPGVEQHGEGQEPEGARRREAV